MREKYKYWIFVQNDMVQNELKHASKQSRVVTVVLIALLVWALVSSSIASYLYLENERLSSMLRSYEARTVLVNIAIDYGNGSVVWFNSTPLPTGSSALTALTAVAKVEYKLSPMGAYVVSVNGVSESLVSRNEGYSWLWYRYNFEKKALEMGPVAADKYTLADGDIIVWRYEHWKF
jgi:hypothetical protein